MQTNLPPRNQILVLQLLAFGLNPHEWQIAWDPYCVPGLGHRPAWARLVNRHDKRFQLIGVLDHDEKNESVRLRELRVLSV